MTRQQLLTANILDARIQKLDEILKILKDTKLDSQSSIVITLDGHSRFTFNMLKILKEQLEEKFENI